MRRQRPPRAVEIGLGHRHPFRARQLEAAAQRALPRIVVRGLMSISEPAADFAAQLAVHQRAQKLFADIAAQQIAGLENFDTLSMGMTDDLDAAVQAGSTMVRVGSGIFGKRSYPNAA